MFLHPLPRSARPELLDAESPPLDQLSGNLRDISRVNRFLGGTSTLLRALARATRADFPNPGTPFSVLDVGTGAGDIPRAVAKWAEANGRTARIWAIDLRSDILRFATETGPRPITLGFARADARALPIRPAGVDYILASLVLHHFDRDAAVSLLREFRHCARRAVIINDLHRGRAPYAAAFLLARMTTRNRMTRFDAPLSVLRAFVPNELDAMAREAGFATWRLNRSFPCRLSLVARPAGDP
jgi:2-polyprenyl-3-methyl-5-hydroxy-6-metoxy-1,4-benzoquinol methylase